MRKRSCFCSQIAHVKLMLLMELYQYKISATEKRWAFLRRKLAWPCSSTLGTQHIFHVKLLDMLFFMHLQRDNHSASTWHCPSARAHLQKRQFTGIPWTQMKKDKPHHFKSPQPRQSDPLGQGASFHSTGVPKSPCSHSSLNCPSQVPRGGSQPGLHANCRRSHILRSGPTHICTNCCRSPPREIPVLTVP